MAKIQTKTPRKTEDPQVKKEPKNEALPNYQEMYPVWQIGYLDIEGKWGYKAFSDIVSFTISDDLLQYLVDNNYQEIHDLLTELERKEHLSINNFLKKLGESRIENFPSDCLTLISQQLQRYFFLSKILPKLKEFERITWREIETITHGAKNKTNNHSIEVEKLCKEAQDRLKELKLDDVDEVYSLRLEGKLRVFGLRELNCLRILWIDREHEICPSKLN